MSDRVKLRGGPYHGKSMSWLEGARITARERDGTEGEYRRMGIFAYWTPPWSWKRALVHAAVTAIYTIIVLLLAHV